MHDHRILLETANSKNLSQYDSLIFFCHSLKDYLKVIYQGFGSKSLYVAWEPAVVDPLHEPESLIEISKAFGGVLTWQDELLNLPRFHRIRYAQSDREWSTPLTLFKDRCLLVNVSGNKSSAHKNSLYEERERIIQHFQSIDPSLIKLYGPGWKHNSNPCYQGLASSKALAYSQGKFALCLENMHGQKGYITEKIFDCFKAGIVPVYLGSPDIDSIIPKGSYIPYSTEDGPSKLIQQLGNITESEHSLMVEKGKSYIRKLGESQFSTRSFSDNLASAFFSIRETPTKVSKLSQLRYVKNLISQKISNQMQK